MRRRPEDSGFDSLTLNGRPEDSGIDSFGIDPSTVSQRPDDSGFDTLNVIEDQKILDLVRCLVCLGLDCEQ